MAPGLLFHAGFPVTISTIAQPRAQVSTPDSYSLLSTDSGAIERGVPLVSTLPVSPLLSLPAQNLQSSLHHSRTTTYYQASRHSEQNPYRGYDADP